MESNCSYILLFVFLCQNNMSSLGDFSLYDSVEVWNKIQSVVSETIFIFVLRTMSFCCSDR